MVARRPALIHERAGVTDLRLDAGVREPVAVGSKLGDAAHEVTIRVAGLPVVRVVKTYDRSDVPVEVATGSSELHASVIELHKLKRPVPLADILKHISMLTFWAVNVDAVVVNVRQYILELKLRAASLAFNHGSL